MTVYVLREVGGQRRYYGGGMDFVPDRERAVEYDFMSTAILAASLIGNGGIDVRVEVVTAVDGGKGVEEGSKGGQSWGVGD